MVSVHGTAGDLRVTYKKMLKRFFLAMQDSGPDSCHVLTITATDVAKHTVTADFVSECYTELRSAGHVPEGVVFHEPSKNGAKIVVIIQYKQQGAPGPIEDNWNTWDIELRVLESGDVRGFFARHHWNNSATRRRG